MTLHPSEGRAGDTYGHLKAVEQHQQLAALRDSWGNPAIPTDSEEKPGYADMESKDRCCADALQQCHQLLRGPDGARWILEGDIKSCFDRIHHDWLLAHVPMDKAILQKWLKAGFLEKNVFYPTTEGTPQGGIISPALANRTLDGLEDFLARHYANTSRRSRKHKVHLVRYADDFIITATSEIQLQYGVQPLVEQFLKERGLELSHEKTRITHSEDGFDFLGQTVRRYPSGKILLRPSKKSVKAFLIKIREVLPRHESCSLRMPII